jgi:universal stress protein E
LSSVDVGSSVVADQESGAAELDLRAGQPRKILVVVDPTAAVQPALDKAVLLASRWHSDLDLLVCDVQQDLADGRVGGASSEATRRPQRTRMLDALDRLAEPVRAKGLKVSTAYEWHAPLEQGIGYYVVRSQPDLVIKETHRHAPVRGPITRTDWILMQQVPAALLLVRSQPWAASPHIAAAVDPLYPAARPTTLDERIAQMGRSLADALDGTLDIFHVLQTPPHLPGDRVTPEQKATAHAKARDGVNQQAASVRGSPHFTEGMLSEGLISLVNNHKPQVLVMGVAARPRSVHAAAGGTAARVLEGVACDLLVVKPQGFVSSLLVTID